MDSKIRHLEMVENIIQRMANNCFQLKGWVVTLVSLIGALAAQGSDKRFIFIAFIPIIAFWGLDSYYLQQERKYRILYNNIIEKVPNDINFSMELKNICFQNDEEKRRIKIISCFFSKSEILFYLPIIVAVFILTLVLIIW